MARAFLGLMETYWLAAIGLERLYQEEEEEEVQLSHFLLEYVEKDVLAFPR